MKFDVVRAWKDATYRKSLSSEELATLPECPAGNLELTDADLEAVQGGWDQHEGCEREVHETNITAAFGNQACVSFAGNCTVRAGGSEPGLVTQIVTTLVNKLV